VTRTLNDLASTATEPSLARARSESLRLAGSVEPTEARRPPTLIARIAADPTRAALPKLEAKPLIVRRPRTIAVAVSAAPRSMLQQAQQALAASGLEPAPALQVHLSCLRHEYLLALSTHADAGPEPLVERAAALGALLSKGVEPQTWSSDLFLFSEPSRTGIAGEVDIRGVGHDGLVMLAGTGRVAGGEMTFILRSMDVPGHMAMIIQGAFRRGSLELTRVQSDAARPRGRTPRSR